MEMTQHPKIMITCNEKKIELPYSFLWVIEYMYQWYKENRDGDTSLIWRSGGVTGIHDKTEKYLSPPKNA